MPDTDPKRLGLIARIIELSARRRMFVFGATIVLTMWGVVSATRSQLDALPDLSDTQVIIATEWMGRNPQLIEDQITYPITTTFLGAPKVKTVRGYTMFGMSFVYVVFEDGTDLYWARSRVVEYLARVQGKLPAGVTPQIGPDATSVGWIYQYALVDTTGKRSLQELRSFQDWSLRYWLQSVPGVAEVASVGGFEKQYQIQIDPDRAKARNVSVSQIAAAVRGANAEVGGRVIEMAQHEYALRGRGYVTKVEDLELAVVATDARGTPIRIRDVADVTIGGNIRRGLVDLDGQGEVVGGIVVMRSGENALNVIDRVKAKLAQVQESMPAGVKVVAVYALPLYTKADAEACLDQLTPVAFHELFTVGEGVTASFTRAGHIIGSGCLRLQLGATSLTFTGDVGRPNDPVMKPPEPLGASDYLVVESTYGDRRHPATNALDELAAVVTSTFERRGTLVVPAFAVGRAQHLLHLLVELRAKRRIPEIPVFLDSPMAINATHLFCHHKIDHGLSDAACT